MSINKKIIKSLKEKSMRKNYESQGVKSYYENNSENYFNPHFFYIKQLLLKNLKFIDLTNILDLASGNGEITKILIENKYDNIVGCDPYLNKSYEKLTSKKCLNLDFKSIIKKGLPNNFSSIICSFGIHLCEEKDLYSLLLKLFEYTEKLVIISPTQKPDLTKYDLKIIHEDSIDLPNKKKIYLKIYQKL